MRMMWEQESAHAGQYTSSSWIKNQINLRARWLNLMMRAVVSAEDVINRNISDDLFRVFTILGTRWVPHHQAVSALLLIGRYGEATALCRMLLEVTDLITYFSLYPKDAEAWRGAFAQTPSSGNDLYTKGRRKFAPSSIRHRLESKGADATSQRAYEELSTAIHGSEWGAQYYARRSIESPETLALQFWVTYDARMSFRLAALANATLPLPISAFLEMCNYARAPKSV